MYCSSPFIEIISCGHIFGDQCQLPNWWGWTQRSHMLPTASQELGIFHHYSTWHFLCIEFCQPVHDQTSTSTFGGCWKDNPLLAYYSNTMFIFSCSVYSSTSRFYWCSLGRLSSIPQLVGVCILAMLLLNIFCDVGRLFWYHVAPWSSFRTWFP